jgi:hypothetical protein
VSNRVKGYTAVPNLSTSYCATLGLFGGVLATALGSTLSPDHAVSAARLLALAIVYVAMVFGTAATTTYLGLLLTHNVRATSAKEVAVRTAITSLWLPPLLMFYGQRSWFVSVISAVLAIEVARLIAFLKGSRSPATPTPAMPESHRFSVLQQDFPSSTSILSALMIQGAIFCGLGGRDGLAGLLYVLGIVTLTYRAFQMFLEVSALNHHKLKRRTWAMLATTTLLIIFAWLPYLFVPGGIGSGGNSPAGTGSAQPQSQGSGTGIQREQRGRQGNSSSVFARLQSLFSQQHSAVHGSSFAIAKRILDSSLPEQSTRTGTRTRNTPHTNIATLVPVLGPVFPGVELYPEAQPRRRLLAPPPLTTTSGPGIGHPDPLSIPFDGVYWFWRGPSDQPPLNSVVMHGSPSARSFRSTDGDGMSMEARQNLGFAVDPRRYSSIEIDIQNSDPFPNTVSILLKVRNTTIPGLPIQTLGMKEVSTRGSSAESRPSHQTLRFRIPGTILTGTFDELTVSYYLKGARGDRSARIAIEAFRLVPRGG